MICLGIDIGLTGAVGAVDSRGSCQVADIPVRQDGKTNRIDGRALILMLRNYLPADGSGIVLFEDVRARPDGNGGSHGNTMHSQGSLMRSRGIVEAVLDIQRVRVEVVQPQVWKRAFGLLGKKKDDARITAMELYPMRKHELRLKKHHNRGDAILIAHFGLERFA